MAEASAPEKAFPVSWEELHRTGKALAWRLIDVGPFEGIIAITRGGLVPAAIVSRELAIRVVDTVCVTTYGTSGSRHRLRHHLRHLRQRQAARRAEDRQAALDRRRRRRLADRR